MAMTDLKILKAATNVFVAAMNLQDLVRKSGNESAALGAIKFLRYSNVKIQDWLEDQIALARRV